MTTITSFDLFSLDLPFKKPFKHAAADRSTSDSIVLKCTLESGRTGFGECLPREYVTGETRDRAFALLQDRILPRLIGREFNALEPVKAYLADCDGKAPAEWVSPDTPQTAAWAAVDLALLDAFGREFREPVRIGPAAGPAPAFRYSAVFSADRGLSALKTLLKIRIFGIRQAKLKVEDEAPEQTARLARLILGKGCDIRVDANMAWDVPRAAAAMKRLARHGIHFFEQPLPADDIDGLARLVRETGLGIMVDESLSDRESMDRVIENRACTAVNVRISKCGGLMAAYNRCRRALEAGLIVQVGCQVGETSLLSAAQLILIAAVGRVTYGEGCFGRLLLREDPASPLMQFGYGGNPPPLPSGFGLGIQVNEELLNRYCISTWRS